MTYPEILEKYITDSVKPENNNNLILFEIKSEKIEKFIKRLYSHHQLRLITMKATDDRDKDGSFKIFYIFGIPDSTLFLVPFLKLKNSTEFPSVTPFLHYASSYELEIYTFFGLTPMGHPDIHKIILHEDWPSKLYPLRKDFDYKKRPAKENNPPQKFQEVSGEGIYEIPVGPVHAGIIEPGHFRFSVAGEEIVSLEPKLGYTHKGSEKLFEVLPFENKIRLSERISGDTSFTHSLAYCQAVEMIASIDIPERSKYLRVIYSELERLANHLNDIGFIVNDTAFSFGASSGQRLKEEIMQLCDHLTGSRFLRGVNVVGGVTKDISKEMQSNIEEKLKFIEKDFNEVISIINNSDSVQNRLKGTGILNKQVAVDHDVVGITARALGLPRDARIEYPYAAYNNLPVKIAHQTTGDVYARFQIRISEVYNSIKIILEALKKLPQGKIKNETAFKLKKNAYAISITEGWRGDIVYFVATDDKGEISRVGARDASFLNWAAVPHAVVGNIIPDFPLINKSFNLSYSGYDR